MKASWCCSNLEEFCHICAIFCLSSRICPLQSRSGGSNEPRNKVRLLPRVHGAGRKVFGNWAPVTLLISTDSPTVAAEIPAILNSHKKAIWGLKFTCVIPNDQSPFCKEPSKTSFRKNTELRKKYFAPVAQSCEVLLQLFNKTHLWAEANHRRFRLKK